MKDQGNSGANSRLAQSDVVGSRDEIKSESEILIIRFAQYRSFGEQIVLVRST
jgi:hypothetical protein